MQPWQCLTGRFEDVRIREGGRFCKADREEMVLSVMKAGERVLREEIETQIDIDELFRVAGNKGNPAKKKLNLLTANSMNCSLIFKYKVMRPLLIFFLLVADTLDGWLSRPTERHNSMLDFQKDQSDAIFRRIVMRTS